MNDEQNVTNNIKIADNDWKILKKHFPQCFDKNGNFQLEKFKNNLSQKEINFSTESYGLQWLGKSYARLLASDEATTLLRENEEHNHKPENRQAENLLIKGDNLEVLKHLSNAYHEKIKMIYIDPPYNTGSDGFVYEDDRRFTVKELQVLAGVDEEQAKRILDFTQSHSNSHSAWLTFMYPRLYIARQLLKDDGVIFVSIDDNEVAQLRLLMDEIFGEENFVAELIVRSNPRGSQSSKFIAQENEYIITFSKKIDYLFIDGYKKNDNDILDYNLKDEKGKYRLLGLRQRGGAWKREDRPDMYYPIYVNPNDGSVSLYKSEFFTKEVLPKRPTGEESRWTWGKEKFLKDNHLIIGKLVNRKGEDDFFDIFRKDYLENDQGEIVRKKPRSIIDEKEVNYQNAGNEINRLFNSPEIFRYSKPTFLIKKLVSMVDDTDIILDFFAGSGTTGDAVMQLNADTSTGSVPGNRKFILVQLPEPIDPKKNKAAYDFVKNELKAEPTIFEITKERLIRSANKINRELDEKNKKIELRIADLESQLPTDETKAEIENLRKQVAQNENLKRQNTFKIFETMPIWENYLFEAEDFDPQQELFDVERLTEEDIKALLVTWKTYDGIPLTQDLKPIDFGGYTSYYGNEKLYLMNRGFTTETLKALLEKIDSDKDFDPKSIIAFGYHFDSKNLRELAESVKHFNNKKNLDIDFIVRY